VNAKEKSEEKARPTSSIGKDTSKDRRLTEKPDENFPILVLSKVRQAPHNERIRYYVILYLK